MLTTLLVGFLEALNFLLGLFIWALIIGALMSFLISLGVLDGRNRFVWSVADFLYKVTEPALRPIRRFLPVFGGMDLSPLLLLVIIQFLIRPLIVRLLISAQTGVWPGFV